MLSARYHGLGIPNMAINCLAGKIHFILCAWEFEEGESNMKHQAYAILLVEVGLTGKVLARNFTKLGILASKDTLFQNLKEFASHLKVAINLDSKFHLKPVQVDGVLVMERFLMISMDDTQLDTLNHVRSYKKVLFLSDVVHCDGTMILPSMINLSEGSL